MNNKEEIEFKEIRLYKELHELDRNTENMNNKEEIEFLKKEEQLQVSVKS